MLAKIDTQQLDFRPRAALSDKPTGDETQAKPADLLQDGFPYFYLTAGFAAIFATLYITDWFWILPHSLLVAGAACHTVLFLSRRRHEPTSAPRTDSATIP